MYWLINVHDTAPKVAAKVAALTFEGCRPGTLAMPALSSPVSQDQMQAAVDAHRAKVAAHEAACEAGRPSFDRAKAFIASELALYAATDSVGVTARCQESPPGSGSIEFVVSISKHG
jgi:hypothetical protein